MGATRLIYLRIFHLYLVSCLSPCVLNQFVGGGYLVRPCPFPGQGGGGG